MRPARVLGVANPMSFPDDMSDDEIRAFLQQKFNADMMKRATGEVSDTLAPQADIAAPYEPSLMEKAGQGVADVLSDTGIISNRYGAQQIGKNVASIGELLPGIGDVAAVDDFVRAKAKGDNLGMGLAALGVIPVGGDLAKKAGKALSEIPMGEFTKFSDKVAARRGAKLSVWDLPTKGKAENIKHITDLQGYTPEQLVNQMKTLDNVGIRQGGYLKKGDGLDIFYKDNGTSDMIDPKTGNVVFANDVEQTGNIIKDDILNTAEGVLTPEQRATEFQARKANDAINNAREAALQDSYKMQHTAPMRGDNPSGDDLTAVFDKDIYTGNAKRFFGTGASYDDKAIRIIQGMKGKPEKSVTIYRAVPKDVKEINATDWITTTKEYAQDHMEGEKGWHILSKKVKAKDIATDGNSIHEFGYDPASQAPVDVASNIKPAGGNKLNPAGIDLTKEMKDEGFNLDGTWFHGSDNEFDEFDFGRSGDNFDAHYGKGAYFASKYNHASEHGKVKNFKLGIKNPMKWDLTKVKEARDKGMELSDYAKSLGHDGIIVGDRYNAQIVAFDNDQIKLDNTEY